MNNQSLIADFKCLYPTMLLSVGGVFLLQYLGYLPEPTDQRIWVIVGTFVLSAFIVSYFFRRVFRKQMLAFLVQAEDPHGMTQYLLNPLIGGVGVAILYFAHRENNPDPVVWWLGIALVLPALWDGILAMILGLIWSLVGKLFGRFRRKKTEVDDPINQEAAQDP